MNHCVKILLFLISFIYYEVLSQSELPEVSTNINQNGLSTGFEKNINTFKWLANLNYQNEFGRIDFNIQEQFNSNLIKTTKTLYRDEQLLKISSKYKLNQNIKLFVNFNSFLVSDNLETGMSNITSHIMHSGVFYSPYGFITIEPAIGLRADKQMGEYDAGNSIYLKIGIPELNLQGYKNHLEGLFQKDNLRPRSIETKTINFNNRKIFSENTFNSLFFLFKDFRRDFYIIADSTILKRHPIRYNIERRRENLISLMDSISYMLNHKLNFSLFGNLNYRTIEKSLNYKTQRDFNNQIKDLKIFSSINIRFYPTTFFSGFLELNYFERNVTHILNFIEGHDFLVYNKLKNLEIQKNNYTRRTTIAGNFVFYFSDAHKISISSSNSVLRYDTPSPINDDDRDELWISHNITSYNKLNDYLKLQLSLDANLIHIVYLLKTRSGSNNWNRILKLSPKLDYTPSKYFSSTNIAEVLANYTTFDYEHLNIPIKSYMFRQFSFFDSTRLSITERLYLLFYNKIILYERGELNWRYFKSKPINFNEENTVIFQIQQHCNQNLVLSTGLRYFYQKKHKYEGRKKQLQYTIRSTGPMASIDYKLSNKMVLTINGWAEYISYTDSPFRINTNFMMNLNKIF